jgi:UDP-N-acetylglucosamine pyrophosphorylase
MNSFNTSADTREALSKMDDVIDWNNWEILQSQTPKLLVDTLAPVDWPRNKKLEWCPPGHGDIYPSLRAWGALDKFAASGIEYLFVSNVDNLGAHPDLRILGYLEKTGLDFLMEVAIRTSDDKKGGHLARRKSDSRLVLREIAQCPELDREMFQDIQRHRFFNTNNLWLRVSALKKLLDANGDFPRLPIIRNLKTVDSADRTSRKVIQIETAMGAAIECFDRVGVLEVKRDRFAPVKITNDLLALRSDVYVTGEDCIPRLHPDCNDQRPNIDLDTTQYGLIGGFERLVGANVPSLRKCKALKISGPVKFAPGVVIKGTVAVAASNNEERVLPAGVYEDGDF